LSKDNGEPFAVTDTNSHFQAKCKVSAGQFDVFTNSKSGIRELESSGYGEFGRQMTAAGGPWRKSHLANKEDCTSSDETSVDVETSEDDDY
jgi:hypothetical protein